MSGLGIKGKLKQFVWRALPHLPTSTRQKLVRGWFLAPESLPADLTFKRAETSSEIEQAFKLIHDSYAENGLSQKHPSSLRITKYHAMPTTSILIAKQGDEVIATLSVIVDSALGLPVEMLWNIDHLRAKRIRIAEISSLAIKHGHRKQGGKLLLPLFSYLYHYCSKVLGVDNLVAVTHPRASYFYSDILLFSPLNGGVAGHHAHVRGNPAVAQWLEIGPEAERKYEQVYGKLPDGRNLFEFFTRQNVANFIVPETSPAPALAETPSPEMIEYFFRNQVDLLEELNNHERTVFTNVYFMKNYRSVLELSRVQSNIKGRQHPRFEVLCNGRLNQRAKNAMSRATVLEVSRAGMKVRLNGAQPPLDIEDIVHVTVELAPHKHVLLRTQATWIHGEFLRVGFKIVGEPPTEWVKFIDQLESGLDKGAA